MPEKLDAAPKPGRDEAKPRKRETDESALEREAALVLAATQFKALGDPTRLRIINFLSSVETMAASEDDSDDFEAEHGRTVGDVSAGVFGKSKVSSTLSHHLKELRNAGLIAMKRRGKNLICRIQPDTIESLRCYLPEPMLIPVTTKAQNAAPKAEIPASRNETDGAEKSASPARTRVRKSAVRKKKMAEGKTHLESGIQPDDTSAI